MVWREPGINYRYCYYCFFRSFPSCMVLYGFFSGLYSSCPFSTLKRVHADESEKEEIQTTKPDAKRFSLNINDWNQGVLKIVFTSRYKWYELNCVSWRSVVYMISNLFFLIFQYRGDDKFLLPILTTTTILYSYENYLLIPFLKISRDIYIMMDGFPSNHFV